MRQTTYLRSRITGVPPVQFVEQTTGETPVIPENIRTSLSRVQTPATYRPDRRRAVPLAFAATLLAAAAACNFIATPPARADAPATHQPSAEVTAKFHVDVKKTLEFLAADEQEGRGIGTAGLERSAQRIADDFQKLGLKPVPGLDGYFQPFKMTMSSSVDPSTALSDGQTSYKVGTDFGVIPFSGEGTFEGDVVFAGYGISSKKYNYDDYAGIDVKGKVVLVLRFEPHNEKGTSRFVTDGWSDEAHLDSKVQAAVDHGAKAIVMVNPPTYTPADALVPFSRTAGIGGDGQASVPFIQIHENVADAWLKQAGAKDLKTLQADIDKDQKPASVVLDNVKIKGLVAIRRDRKDVKNVVAMVPGTGKSHEYLIVGAHYDHLGWGSPFSLAHGVHAIHHGADDNASGTSAMLKIADHFAHAKPGEKTIIFMAFTGEEEGLIGSQYFVSHPPIRLNKVVAMLNLDMVGRISKNVLYVGGQGTAPSFDAFLKEANEDSPLVLKSIGRGGLGPSDHMTFAMKKIPVLFLFSGMHIDYHRPTDTADKINYQGIDETVKFSVKLLDGLQDMPREKYVDAADKDSMMGMGHAGSSAGGGSSVSLGVIPDYSELDSATKGVKISGTMPDSGAAKAGLLGGDIIVQWNDKKLDSLLQLQNLLDGSKPGDKVKLGVLRNGKRIELEATLTERK
ncbi:MAG TPA: M28 family peptidase [Tepidisphaeraceae bacterium]|nr:M28 family peptidase [Tepidisphaeraceae bacterium]